MNAASRDETVSNAAVVVSRAGSVGRVTLARPDRRNPLDQQMSACVLAGLEQHFGDEQVRSVIIDAQGDAFCAGADLRQVRDLPAVSTGVAHDWPADIVRAQELMLDAPKPVIAAVQGPAYAGGLGLAAMCDVIIATRSATFATPEVKIGLFPMIIVAQLERALPRKVLLEMMLTGDPISADDAHRLGFVNRVVDTKDDLEEAALSYAQRFERASPEALRLGRRAFSVLGELSPRDALRAAQLFNVPFFLGADFGEGSSAFLEKRAPRWKHSTEGAGS